jgi:predicted DNA-binding ribbon-helix-helix protein
MDEENLSDLLNAPLEKHSVRIDGHPTSLTLEKTFWDAFKNLAAQRNISINKLASEIDRARSGNLSSAVRLYVLHSLTQK